MEVVHEGPLERCIHVSDTKKDWKKGYFVFKRHKVSGSRTLEYFKDSNWKKQEAKGVVNLFSGYNVSIVNNTKKKYMFELVTVDRTYELYASSESARQKWIDVLNDGALAKYFDVVLIDSPPSAYQSVRDIRGTSQLQINDSSVILISGNSKTLTWKFSTIRRYKSHNGAFVLEVGRKAETGEGEFRFDTANPAELFDVLDKAVKERSKQSKSKISESQNILRTNEPMIVKKTITASPSAPQIASSPSQTSTLVNNDYSHIHSLTNHHATVKNELAGDYDKLFSHNRMVKHRNSEPVIRPNNLPLFDSTSLLTSRTPITAVPVTSRTPITAVPETEEVYMDMTGVDTTAATPEVKQRPTPPPRVKNIGSPVKEPQKEILRKSYSTPIEENTYDAPTSPRKSGIEIVPKDYDHLFNQRVSNDVVEAPNYSHLNHDTNESQRNHSEELVEESVYDMPKSAKSASPQKSDKIDLLQSSPKKLPLKPIRPAPLVPPQPPINRQETRKIATPGSPGGVILKLRRNLEMSGFDPSQNVETPMNEQPTYDTPSPTLAEPISYNKVGDIIHGEYQVGPTEDKDGYVKVPNESSEDGDIYQVPRGERAL